MFATRPDKTGTIEPLTRFTTNPASSAVVNAIGPIRQVLLMQEGASRRYLVILRVGPGEPRALRRKSKLRSIYEERWNRWIR